MIATILHHLNLDSDLEHYDKIHNAIEQGINFRGTNLWILVFAIIIASVGLNMNSTAVIIGAMLISPLMPPLCTAGYGLGTGQYNYFIGAFYLFTINTVFIAISSVIISQVLNFPIRTPISDAQKSRINRWITVITVATLIPSIYFGYGLAQKEKFQQRATQFVGGIGIVEGNYLLKSEIDPAHKRITLVYGGNSLSEEHKQTIRGRLKDFSIDDAEVSILQGFSFSDALGKTTELDNLKGQNNQLLVALNENKRHLDSIKTRMVLGKQLLAELRVLYPQVTACTYAESFVYGGSDQPEMLAIVIVAYTGRQLKNSDEATITGWLTARVRAGRIKTYFDRS